MNVDSVEDFGSIAVSRLSATLKGKKLFKVLKESVFVV